MATQATHPRVRGNWKRIGLIILGGLILLGLYPVGRAVWATVHYRQALRAIDRKDFAEARRHLNVCLHEWPDSAETRFLAARTARRAGELRDAQSLLKEAEQLGWVSEAIGLERALISLQQGRRGSLGATLLDFVRRHHPDSVIILEVLTPITLSSLDVGPARECLDAWIALEPANPHPHLLKGDLLERTATKRDALKEYQEIVRLDPDNVEARLRCGRLLMDAKSLAEAKPHFDWLWSRRPNDPNVRRGMAQCLHNLGRDDEARQLLDALLAERPDDGDALADRGILELDAGNPVAAEPWLRQAAALLPHEPAVMYNFARCLEQCGKFAEAESARQLGKQIEIDLRQVSTLMRDVVTNPYDAEPRRQIAIRFMRHGLDAEAKRWLESGLEHNPRHRATYETLADYYERFADRERAAEYRRLAAELPEPKWYRPWD